MPETKKPVNDILEKVNKKREELNNKNNSFEEFEKKILEFIESKFKNYETQNEEKYNKIQSELVDILVSEQKNINAETIPQESQNLEPAKTQEEKEKEEYKKLYGSYLVN